RKIEQEQLDNFLKAQEQRILAAASTVTVGAEKEEVTSQQQAIQARREMLRLLASKVVVGRMVVHLAPPDTLRGTGEDVVLIDGDTLEVPEPPQSVLVLGSVRNSTSVQYKPGANADYYINRVGGFSKEADKKETHIVKADGSAISSFTNVREVEPGDAIIVPPKAEEKIRALPAARGGAQTTGSGSRQRPALLLCLLQHDDRVPGLERSVHVGIDLGDVEPGDAIVVPPKAEEKLRALPTIRDVVRTIGADRRQRPDLLLGLGRHDDRVAGLERSVQVGIDLVDVAAFRARFDGHDDLL